MNKAEELAEFLKDELYNIYCYNCRHQNNCENDMCYRKYMGWQVSDGVIAKAVEIATREDK